MYIQHGKGQENSAGEVRILGEEELRKTVGGGTVVGDDVLLTSSSTNNMLCPYCKKKTAHTLTPKGMYVCNRCNQMHPRVD